MLVALVLGAEVSERACSQVAVVQLCKVKVIYLPHHSPETGKGAIA
jgi:hypothetical protein